MVQEVSCKKQSQLQKEYLDQLPLAKGRIKAYPILNRYFDNFKSYEDEAHYKNSGNIIFRSCIRRPRVSWLPFDSITVLVDSPLFPTLLQELENAIDHFGIDKSWLVKEKKHFKSKLTSTNSHTSQVTVSELLIPYRIDKKIGPNKVKIQSKISSGKRPDNLLEVGNGKQLFLELTSLEPRNSEEKIKRICNDLAEYLNSKCDKNNYTILIHFDTAVLIPLADRNGHIDEQIVKKFLDEWTDKLLLHELAGCEGNIYFENNSGVEGPGFLIDIFQGEFSSISLPSELYKMIKEQRSVREWAMKVRIEDFLASPFENVIYNKALDNECVMVNSVEFDSTSETLQNSDILKTSKVVKKGFKDQLLRAINYKINLQQYVQGEPVIFGINAFEWRFMFEEDYDEFAELRDIIQNEISKTDWLSGVIIYYSDFYNGRYIQNENAPNQIQVTEKKL